MRNAIKSVTMVAICASLGACQSLGLPGLTRKAPSAQPAWSPARTVDHSLALEEGRAALRAGNLSTAAALLRIAQQNPDTRAAASNGLGVVYVQLGRRDLAERYFRLALAADPANPKYAANLVRLQTEALALADHLQRTAVAANQPARDVAEARTGIATAARRGTGDVFIQTPGVLAPAPAAVVSSRTVAKHSEKAEPAVDEPTASKTIAHLDRGRSYPIRIELAP